MKQYHKIKTMFKRNHDNMKYVLDGVYADAHFEFLSPCEWVWTEKVDGTNIRVMWKDGFLNYGGKTDNAQIHANLYARLNELLPTSKFQELYPDMPMCLYGEGYGAKIQKGGGNYKPDGQEFVLFDIRIGEFWLDRENVCDIADKLGCKVVPIVGRGSLPELAEYVKSKPNSQWGEFESEGVVARPSTELYNRQGHRIITKLKCKDFS